MKTYRMNARMIGILYILGTVFGIMSAILGGELLGSLVSGNEIQGAILITTAAETADKLPLGALMTLCMGISLGAMSLYAYPVIKKKHAVLAGGVLLFRGALETTWYFISSLCIILMSLLGKAYIAGSVEVGILQGLSGILYQFQSALSSLGSILFLLGAACLYIAFYISKLIPRWISVWGLIGVVPYLIAVMMNYFGLESSLTFYLLMILAPQEMVMGIWLIVKGFDKKAIQALD